MEKEQSRRRPLAETQIKTHSNEKTLIQQKKGEMNHPMTADAGKEKRRMAGGCGGVRRNKEICTSGN